MNRRTNDSLVCSWVITLELLIHMIQDITRYNVIYCFLWRKSLNSLMFCILYWKTLAISDSVCRKGSERGNVVCIWSDMRKRNGPRTVVISKTTCLLFVIVYVLQTKIKVEVSTRISRKKIDQRMEKWHSCLVTAFIKIKTVRKKINYLMNIIKFRFYLKIFFSKIDFSKS